MAAADYDARSVKKALAQRGTCIDGSWSRPCPASAVDRAGCGRAPEAYARVVDYRLLIEKAATRRAAELPASEREAFIEFVTGEVDFDMTRFYATSAMVDLFEASEL